MNWISTNFADFLTTVSILVALLTWLLTQKKNSQKDRINFTLQVLGQTKTLEHLAKADFLINKAINENVKIELADMNLELESAAFLMLNYYEDLSTWHEIGIIDGEILKHLRGGLMKRTYILFEPYINNYRKKQNRNEIYKKLNKFIGAVEY